MYIKAFSPKYLMTIKISKKYCFRFSIEILLKFL